MVLSVSGYQKGGTCNFIKIHFTASELPIHCEYICKFAYTMHVSDLATALSRAIHHHWFNKVYDQGHHSMRIYFPIIL